jgi:hypothetical protein
MTIHSVISVCCIRDISVWAIAAPKIIGNIDAENYYVIVPSSDISKFKEISPIEYTVLDEVDVLPCVSIDSIAEKLPESYKYRAGWYLQQLIKIAALEYVQADGDRLILIWDADTVPLKKLDFYKDGRCIYFMGIEHHPPYFISLSRLLNLNKLVDFSFIAQCFVMKKKWIGEFIAELEGLHKIKWFQAILEKSDLSHPSGFSEYETLGNWLMVRHKSEIAFNPMQWERYGSSKCGLKNIDQYKTIQPNISFISFESWDGHIAETALVQMSTLGRNGRFGNQIFQYFFLRTVQDKLGYEIRNPIWLGDKLFNLESNKELISSALPIDWGAVAQRTDTPELDLQRIDYLMSKHNTNSLDISGYFHYHTKNLRPYKNFFLSVFKINNSLISRIYERLDILNIRCVIAVHVRATDYISLEKESGGFGYAMSPNFDEIKLKLDELQDSKEGAIVYLASDDLSYSSKELNLLGIKHITCRDIFPEESAYEDLFTDFSLLSLANYILISNSSFSFSAAMLNQNAKLFFRPCIKTKKYLPFDPWNDFVLQIKNKTLYV